MDTWCVYKGHSNGLPPQWKIDHTLDSAVRPNKLQNVLGAGLFKLGVPTAIEMVEGYMTGMDDPAHHSVDCLLTLVVSPAYLHLR